MSRRLFWLLPLALLPVPLLLNPYQQYVLNTALLYVPVGIGFNLVVGNLGLLAFSNVAYFGLGAYTSGVLMAQLGLPWWLTVIPAALAGGIGGAVASIPALRGVRLFYLAIMTLAFGELMRWTYIRWEALTGGSMGMAVPTADLFGWTLDTDRRRFYVFLALVVLLVAITDRLLRRVSAVPSWRSRTTRSRPPRWASRRIATSCSPSPGAAPWSAWAVRCSRSRSAT